MRAPFLARPFASFILSSMMALLVLSVPQTAEAADSVPCRIQIHEVVFLGFPADLSGDMMHWQEKISARIKDQVQRRSGCEVSPDRAVRAIGAVVTYTGPNRAHIHLHLFFKDQPVASAHRVTQPELSEMLHSMDTMMGMVE